MKSFFLQIIIFLFVNTTKAQMSINILWTDKANLEQKNTIYYNAAKKLIWSDFKGYPTLPEPVAAITASGFGYKSAMHAKNGKGEITVSIYCYFDKQNSWVRNGKNTQYILNHEQHHFDITYISAKMFINKVRTATLTITNMEVLLSKIYNESVAYMNKMQNNYDKETNNGQTKQKQEEWNTFIEAKL